MSLLPAVEPGRHGVWPECFQAKLVGPVIEGGRRCSEAAGPVHGGGATHAAALQNGDSAVPGYPAHAFLVEIGIGGLLVHLEVFLVVKPALLHEDYGQPTAGQNFGGGAAAGAGPDHHNVGFRGQVCLQVSAIGDVPARFQALGNTIS